MAATWPQQASCDDAESAVKRVAASNHGTAADVIEDKTRFKEPVDE